MSEWAGSFSTDFPGSYPVEASIGSLFSAAKLQGRRDECLQESIMAWPIRQLSRSTRRDAGGWETLIYDRLAANLRNQPGGQVIWRRPSR